MHAFQGRGGEGGREGGSRGSERSGYVGRKGGEQMRGEVERGYRNGEERDRKGREDVGKRTRNGGWRERGGKRKGEERERRHTHIFRWLTSKGWSLCVRFQATVMVAMPTVHSIQELRV